MAGNPHLSYSLTEAAMLDTPADAITVPHRRASDDPLMHTLAITVCFALAEPATL
jgi:hypothetical protein